jgi:peptidase A4-like protein
VSSLSRRESLHSIRKFTRFLLLSGLIVGASLVSLFALGVVPVATLTASSGQGLSSLNIPAGVYLGNPNIPATAIAPANPEVGFVTAASSFNWGGYAVSAAVGSVTFVYGSWKVPTVGGPVCASTAWHASVAFVGIDGFNSGTVEQTGTASQCYEGAVQYYAWYEFYPAASVIISSVTVSPGNVIQANVTFSGGFFTTGIKDVTTGHSFKSAPTAVTGAQESSAEWITESPAGQIGVLELPNFGTVSFTAGKATIGGLTKSIGSFSGLYSLAMVDYPAGSPVKSTVSALSGGGKNFSVKYVSSGPYG